MESISINTPRFSDNLDTLLSLSPPPDPNAFDDPELFKDLTDYIDEKQQSGKSPIHEYLSSDSDSTEVDIENEPFEVSSVGDDELINYLTKREEPNTQTLQQVNGGIYKTFEKKSGNRHQILRLSSSRNNEQKPFIVSGNHSVVKIPESQVNALKSGRIRIIKRVEVRDERRSISPAESEISNTSRSLSKSAIAARENRQKKKKYIEHMEKNVQELGAENKVYKAKVYDLENEVESLKNEVLYLKSVLANQSTLSKLLNNIPGITGVTLKSSEISTQASKNRKRNMEQIENADKNILCACSDVCKCSLKKQKLDHDYASSNSFVQKSFSGYSKKPKAMGMPGGGVCLHVADGEASLEFCSECSRKASCGRDKLL